MTRLIKSVLIGAMLVSISCFAIVAIHIAYIRYEDPNFCSVNDEVYQTIVADVDKWIAIMDRRSLDPNDITWTSLGFSTPSGRTYIVAATSYPYYRSYLLVVVKRSWNEQHGFKGYIYSTDHAPYLTDKYEVKQLSNDIYCYKRKPGYD